MLRRDQINLRFTRFGLIRFYNVLSHSNDGCELPYMYVILSIISCTWIFGEKGNLI